MRWQNEVWGDDGICAKFVDVKQLMMGKEEEDEDKEEEEEKIR